MALIVRLARPSNQEFLGSIPGSSKFTFIEVCLESFSTAFFALPLIYVGPLPVTGERGGMHGVLVSI